MAHTNEATDNAVMNEQIYIDMALRDQAADLVYQTFDDPTDAHIDCVYARLTVNRQWGLGSAGAVTVH